MAEPVRRIAAGPGDDPERPGPAVPGWGYVQRLVITAAEGAAMAAAELAARPGSAAALRRAEVLRDALADLGGLASECAEIARRQEVGEAFLEAERERGFAAGVAACKAARCRLEVIDGGRAP